MFHNVRWIHVAAALAAANLVCPLSMLRADETPIAKNKPAATPVDYTLGAHGELVGKIVRPDGSPAEQTEVILSRNDKELGRTACDERGAFVFSNLKGGLYDVRTARGTRTVRAWNADAAPPAAKTSLTFVDGLTVRGQAEWDYLEVDEAIIGGIGLAALTVGIFALVEAEDDDDNPASP